MTPSGTPAPTEVLQEALVRQGWAMIEALERMDQKSAERLIRDRLRAQVDAASSLTDLQVWPAVPERNLKVYRHRPNQVRMRRVLDLMSSADRVVDVGTNYGYLTGIILKHATPSYYCGIDLADHLIESVRDMMRVNGLPAEGVHLERKNLYDIDREWMSHHAPDLVVLLEVLEHVPDPRAALQTLAAAMPARASIAFSVPILGRLEACWGHVSLFDAARVRQLCDEAGLHVQHVEALYNTWTLVVASPTAHTPQRILDLVRTEPFPPPAQPVEDYVFVNVPLRDDGAVLPSRWTKRCGAEQRLDADGLHRDASANEVTTTSPGSPDDGGQSAYLGARLRLDAPRVLRLETLFRGAENVRRVHVDGYGADGGKPVERWTWDAALKGAPSVDPTTVVLRRGQSSGAFRSKVSDPDVPITSVEVFVEFEPGRAVGLTLRRVAYVR